MPRLGISSTISSLCSGILGCPDECMHRRSADDLPAHSVCIQILEHRQQSLLSHEERSPCSSHSDGAERRCKKSFWLQFMHTLFRSSPLFSGRKTPHVPPASLASTYYNNRVCPKNEPGKNSKLLPIFKVGACFLHEQSLDFLWLGRTEISVVLRSF